MKIKELIEQLQQLDPELHVFVRGYEGGYNDVEISQETEVALNYNKEWYYGKHDSVDTLKLRKKNISDYTIVKGIIL